MVLQLIRSILGLLPDDQPGVEALKEALHEPKEDVDVYGRFLEPYLDPQGTNTAVVPVELIEADTAQQYAEIVVEFAIESDEGRELFEDFLSQHGIDVDTLEEIAGEAAEVLRDENGNYVVDW